MNAKMDQCVSKMQNVSTQPVATDVTANLATGSRPRAAALVSASGLFARDFKRSLKKPISSSGRWYTRKSSGLQELSS